MARPRMIHLTVMLISPTFFRVFGASLFALLIAPLVFVAGIGPAYGVDAGLSGNTSVDYTEGADSILALPDITISGGPFDGQYIDFEVDPAGSNSDDKEDLFFTEVADLASISTTSGAISVFDGKIYLGEGSGNYSQIGQISSTFDGLNGNKLRVEFISSFSNAGFEEVAASDTNYASNPPGTALAGWEARSGVVLPGSTSIQPGGSGPSYTVPDDWTKWNTCAGAASAAGSMSTSTAKVISGDKSEGSQSLELFSSGSVPYGKSMFGPMVWSDEFTAESGQTLYFDWRALSGSDNYQILAYMLNTGNGSWAKILDAHGTRNGDQTNWATASVNISANSTYRFVFISGSQDATCGGALGARLRIDNVKVVGSKALAAPVQALARLLRYFNDGDGPDATQTLRVTAKPTSGATATQDHTIRITGVNDAPSVDGDGSTTSIAVSISETDASSEDSPIANSTGTLSAIDPDNDSPTFTYGVSGGTVSGSTVSKAGSYGTLTVNSATGTYTYVPDMAAIKPLNDGDTPTDTFGLTVSDGALSGSGSLVFTINGNSPPSINSPSIQSFEPSTSATAVDNDFVVAGFDGTVLVSIGLSDAPSGTGFALPNFASSGASKGAGFTSVNPATATTEFSMTGTQSQVNAALAGMTITTGSARSNFTVNVSASNYDANVVQSGITQSFYEYVANANISWDAAKTAAEAKTFAGVNGYLVTITSAEENDFVKSRISGAENVWIGASDSGEEGVWKWVTGPEGAGGGTTFFLEGANQDASDDEVVTYASWASNEPNDWTTGEDSAVTNWDVTNTPSNAGKWNDYTGTTDIGGYVVEYSEWNNQTFSSNSVVSANSAVSMGGPVLSGTPAPVSAQLSWTTPTRSGQTVSSYAVSVSPSVGGQTTFCSGTSTSCTISGLTAGSSYSFTVTATWSDSNTSDSNVVSVTALAAQSSGGSGRTTTTAVPNPVVPPPVVVPPRATTPPQVTLPTGQSGPVLRGGVVPTPPKAPTVLLGGRPTVMTTTVPTTTQLDVRAGALSLGVKVLEDQGEISEAPDGTTEIAVRKGAAATITGSGFRPGATVQVFMPLQGDNAKELTRIPVQPDGSFDGSAPFATRSNEAPLPIGKNVLQLVSLDNDGNQVVVEMAVNIAQGAPAPEQNRIDGVIPTMTPGQSVATSGGAPVPVRITPVSEQKLAVVEGDGWSMAVNVAAEDGGVEPSEGGALLKLVRNESALVSGSGFMPGTRADVWLFSDPTLLGTVTIDENGEFTGEVNIDPNMIPVGEHTLQLQGVGEDGYVKAANMGVLVDDPVEAAPTAVEQGLGFIWWIIAALVLLAVIVVLIASRRRREA